MGKGRAPCCDKSKVKRGPWSHEEDMILTTFIHKHGHTNWRSLPIQAGLLRCGKSCRLRWINYLRPDLKRGDFTKEEEETIIKLHRNLGNKWSKIASYFPGRTDNEIKNMWHTTLKKRLNIKVGDHANHQKAKIHELSQQTTCSSSRSSSSISILSSSKNQVTGEGMEENKPENNEFMENLNFLNPPSLVEYYLHSSVIDPDIMQAADTNILINNAYQGNDEMYLNLDQDIGNLPPEIDFGVLDMLDKKDPIDTQQSESKEFENYQSNSLQENDRNHELMKWMKYLENELLSETVGDAF